MYSPLEIQHLAEAWAQSQSGLRDGWRIPPVRSGSESFNIKWTHPKFKVEFTLLQARITSDGSIVVFNDRRERIRQLVKRGKLGFLKEFRFFEALKERTDQTPSWFVRLFRADTFIDKAGVDGWAKISINERSIKLPFQLKSNRQDREEFYKRRPAYRDVVGVIITHLEDSEDILRNKLYSWIGEVRSRMLKEDISTKEMKQRITAALLSKPR